MPVEKVDMSGITPTIKGHHVEEAVIIKDEPATSPVPKVKKIEMLNFYDALKQVMDGKRVTRIAWDDVKSHVLLNGDFLSINLIDKVSQLIVHKADIEGVDWYVLPEETDVSR